MNEFLATGPFDLYELQLFHLVADHQNFTRAGQAAGLTQSAITRQIRGMEERLGVQLFDRSTRHVRLTPAGAALYARSGAILAGVEDAISAVREGLELRPKILRVGVTRTIGLAYLPGFFRQFQRKFPGVQLQVSQESSAAVLAAIESGDLEVGIVSPPPQLSRALTVTHRFEDQFTVIAPPRFKLPPGFKPAELKAVVELLKRFRWLLISRNSNTGKRLHGWLAQQGVQIEPAMETDNFDLIANLVSLGLGASLVPHRVLALHPRSRPVQRILIAPRFSRELVVVIRQEKEPPAVLASFIENILF